MKTTRRGTLVARRDVLRMPTAVAAGLPLGAAAPPGTVRADEAPVTPSEDLMREHGVLKRVLLIYREGLHRLDTGRRVSAQELNAGARVIRDFIEGHHEHEEERYVFPRFRGWSGPAGSPAR